jgi:two-component system cell cycle response regulator
MEIPVPRIILVDDSASARALLGLRLREEGYEVEDAPDAVAGADLALARPPYAVVTDLWMPGMSGVQLCRLLRAEPATSRVPVILLTASEDRRSRFWARSAGAVAYVTKTEVAALLRALAQLPPQPAGGSGLFTATNLGPSGTPGVARGTVQERLSQLLDTALFESTLAGEARALGQKEGDLDTLFSELAKLASDVATYRWLALTANDDPRLFVHSQPSNRAAAEHEARIALGLPVRPPGPDPRQATGAVATPDDDVVHLEDTRALEGDATSAPLVVPVKFGGEITAKIALGPGKRGASSDDRKLMTLLANEIAGPLRIVALMSLTRKAAATDTLTGLMNRRAFLEAMERESSRASRHMFPMSVLLLDVDHFKKVNDTHGHDAGDAVLQGVARVLRGIARKSDLVARWGGEEFVVALPQTAETGARIAAERIRRALADAAYKLPGGDTIPVTASVGLASIGASDKFDFEEILARADKAMYAAKARGRNRVEVG